MDIFHQQFAWTHRTGARTRSSPFSSLPPSSSPSTLRWPKSRWSIPF